MLVYIIYSQPGPIFINLFVQYSQSDLLPLRPLCGEAPGRDSNPGRADLVVGTLTTGPPHLPYTMCSVHLILLRGETAESKKLSLSLTISLKASRGQEINPK